MTAQVLANALNQGYMQFTDINLLIFDECHHATKNHPYKVIMRDYAEVKQKLCERDDDSGVQSVMPKILGLTACIFTAKVKTVTAMENRVSWLQYDTHVFFLLLHHKTFEKIFRMSMKYLPNFQLF